MPAISFCVFMSDREGKSSTHTRYRIISKTITAEMVQEVDAWRASSHEHLSSGQQVRTLQQ